MMPRPLPGVPISDPPPMPAVRGARLYTHDLIAAAARANCAWNDTQMREAIFAIRIYLDAMQKALDEPPTPDKAAP